ncbi:NlpC/P60 family protein [Margalitia sp. FSL K6-0131]|uniref:C40 family peptidase n=1 Tax=Margalitia sp. FSL K6-0131 TaxID=2954604 RepID=UPI0030F73F22
MKASKIIKTGHTFLGVPYVFDAPSYRTDMFDCSSFIQHIFMVHGISLPRNSRQQSLIGTRISPKQLQKGDLLFFTTRKRKHKLAIYQKSDMLPSILEKAECCIRFARKTK